MGAPEVGVDSQVLEEVVPASKPQAASDEARLSCGVNDVFSPRLLLG